MTTEYAPQTPSEPPDTGGKIVRIAGLLIIGAVALCGLVGFCLFALTLVLPLLGVQ